MKQQHVLITGGAGFLGSSIVPRLLRRDGMRVTLLDPRTPPFVYHSHGSRFQHIAADIDAFLSAVQADMRFDVVVHLAHTTHPASSMRDMLYDAASNLLPGIRLLQHCKAMGVKRFVFASSGGAVYGPSPDDCLSEDHPTNPVSAYGVTKLAMEKYVALIGAMDGFDAISLRVGNPYGSYQLQGVPVGSIASFVLAISESRKISIFGDGSVVRDYLDIEDVAEAYVLAICKETVAPGIYNVGSGRGSSLNDIVAAIERVSGQRASVEHLPARQFDIPRIVLDSGKLGRIVGWTATTDLEVGIARLWDEVGTCSA